jgi:hypothetical protein
MKRKIPLLPTWLLLAAIFGTPFVRGFLAKQGLSPAQVSNLTLYFFAVALIVAGVVLYRMRDQLPARPKKPKRRWFRRDATREPATQDPQ